MNITVQVPHLGYRAPGAAAEQQIDRLRTRMIQGTGTTELPVPGLRAVEKVRAAGLVFDEKIVRELPLDANQKNFFAAVVDTYRLVEGIDGEPFLERHPWSNDGVWQPKETFWITGDWDESVSPPSGAIFPPPETVRQPILTEASVGAADAQATLTRRGAAEKAAASAKE